MFGWHSFFTDEKRLNTIISRNFSSVYELKRDEFLNILQQFPIDLVIY